jgi:hypothetical protein
MDKTHVKLIAFSVKFHFTHRVLKGIALSKRHKKGLETEFLLLNRFLQRRLDTEELIRLLTHY